MVEAEQKCHLQLPGTHRAFRHAAFYLHLLAKGEKGRLRLMWCFFILTLENGEKTKDCGTASRQDTLLGKWFWTWVSERKKAWKALLPISLLPTYLGKHLGSEFLTYGVQELLKGIYKWLAISTDNIFLGDS